MSVGKPFLGLRVHKLAKNRDAACPSWKPAALRAPVLLCAVLVSWLLILILQILLTKSQRDGGILFATKISDVALSRSFSWLYLPTILATLFSIFWSWIDLQAKRMEPYNQLSKPEGAKGKDSLLLCYPFDFVPLVPLKAARKRHWPVFWAGTAIVLVSWGLVPLQAGIFSTATLRKVDSMPFLTSKSALPVKQQRTNITRKFAQSTYGIIWLNETLPKYMSRNYTLAAFQPQSQHTPQAKETWTAATTLYSADLSCEEAKSLTINGSQYLASSNGCLWPATMGITGNDTIGTVSSKIVTKQFSAFYAGFWNDIGFADYYLSEMCPPEANHTFYAAFTRNKQRDSDPTENVTSIFCQSNYFFQSVNATVARDSRHPISVAALGPRMTLPKAQFNTTFLESQMNSGLVAGEIRGALPGIHRTDFVERLSDVEMSLLSSAGELQQMASVAIGAGGRPLADYLDPDALASSYEAAYRLLFSRWMVEILDPTFSETNRSMGARNYEIQALALVPAFTIAVEVLLGLTSLFAIVLIYLGLRRLPGLPCDPGTISALMSIVASNPRLLSVFSRLDCCTVQELEVALNKVVFKLSFGTSDTLIEMDGEPDDHQSQRHGSGSLEDLQLEPSTLSQSSAPKVIAKPVRPKELRLFSAIPFVSLLLLLAGALAFLFIKGQSDGLPLPSQSKLVRQLLENLVPTAIATILEPIWVVVNRLLCMLQPLEELRKGKANARASIGLNYSSLPPQLVVAKAVRAGYYVLALVCTMALFANLLAVALSGLFNEDQARTLRQASFPTPYEAKFTHINGSLRPFDSSGGDIRSYEGGPWTDQFLIAESNDTSGTPLPPWTDQKYMYLPFLNATSGNDTQEYIARTKAFGATLKCSSVNLAGRPGFKAEVRTFANSSDSLSVFTLPLEAESGGAVVCSSNRTDARKGAIPNTNTPDNSYICQKGPSAMEFVLLLDALPNATQAEKEQCSQTVFLGWGREPGPDICAIDLDKSFDQTNSLFVACQPSMVVGDADVRVDSGGYVQGVSSLTPLGDNASQELEDYFSNGHASLLEQGLGYTFFEPALEWHSDSFASDPINYFLGHVLKNSRHLDPNMPPPQIHNIAGPLGEVFSKSFAIWLAENKDKLLIPSNASRPPTLSGWIAKEETRIFVSKPMFIISEVILTTYVVVAVLLYLRRPGRYLARFPTSIASTVALFAASTAVRDLRGTSTLSEKEREGHLAELDHQYGYGSFIGMDGAVHIGIERQPFVRASARSGTRKRTGWLHRKK